MSFFVDYTIKCENLYSSRGIAFGLEESITLGMIAGFYGGKPESLIMRAMDVMMCFPKLILRLLSRRHYEPV